MAEVPQPRKFQDLSPAERVVSMLSVVVEPVSRQLALVFADVNYEELSLDQRHELDMLFESGKLEMREMDGRKIFIADQDLRTEIGETIDLMDVESVLSEKLLKEWERMKRDL